MFDAHLGHEEHDDYDDVWYNLPMAGLMLFLVVQFAVFYAVGVVVAFHILFDFLIG